MTPRFSIKCRLSLCVGLGIYLLLQFGHSPLKAELGSTLMHQLVRLDDDIDDWTNGTDQSNMLNFHSWENQSIAHFAKFSDLVVCTNSTTKISDGLSSERKKEAFCSKAANFSLHQGYQGGNCVQPRTIELIPEEPRNSVISCCLGTLSHGGATTHFAPNRCNIGAKPYISIRDHSLSELEKTNHLLETNKHCDVCQLAEIIFTKGLSMAFVGDSVNSQLFHGLICEYRRRGFSVTVSGERVVRDPKLFFRWGLRNIEKMYISRKIHGKIETITITNYLMYLPNPEDELVEIYNISKDHDIFVMNVGLHVGEFEDHKKRYRLEWMVPILKQLRRSNFTLLAHRETTAQHFDGAGGSWWIANAKEKIVSDMRDVGGCTKIQNGDPEAGWREPIVRSAAKKAGYNIIIADESIQMYPYDIDELVILPFYNFTAPHHDLHPTECTHYCSTPHLWMPIWRSLRLALDRKFGLLRKL